MKKTAVEISNLSKCYRLYEKANDRVKEVFSFSHKTYGREKYVLRNLSLQIEKGDVVGIIGTNGAGKSTLLKIITGVLMPTAGTVRVEGQIAAMLELGAGFNPEFTGMKNIYLNGAMMGYSREEMSRKVQDIIDFADIGDFISQPVKTYSSGMFARLAFAVAVSVEPQILIVDEVLSVGDLRFQMKCMDKMKSMMNQGVTVLFVSHDINAVRRLCTKAVWLSEGTVREYGETNRVCDQYLDDLKIGERVLSSLQTEYSKEADIRELQEKKKASIADIAGIQIINADGLIVDEFDLLEPVKVSVFYDVYDETIQNPVLGVALKKIDDVYICGVNTMLDHIKIPWKRGRNCFSLYYQEGIRTFGGRYYFDVGLFDSTATVTIQYRAKIKEFLVTADYVGEGVCIIPHIWRE